MTRIALLGLGEAGRMFATGLATTADVVGWDPFVTEAPPGVRLAGSGAEAVAGAQIVLALTTAVHSESSLSITIEAAAPGTLHADCATAEPSLKLALAERAAASGLRFADVAIMAPVRRGADATPLLLAGPGAADLAGVLTTAGMPVTVVDGPAGDAAARKLLRSMLVKGLTGVMVESLRTSENLGVSDWFAEHLVETVVGLDRVALSGLLDGTARHSARRIEEMEAAAAMAETAGGRAEISRAVADVLRSVAEEGVPHGGRL